MSLEPAESAAIHVCWAEAGGTCYELRWYAAPEFVVSMWWLGISDLGGELECTEVLVPKAGVPGEVFQWLRPLVGPDAARRLISKAASVAVPAAVAGF